MAIAPFSLPSPAKINRFLHITGRQANGYHTLQTVLQFVDLSETCHFFPQASSKISLSPVDMQGIPFKDNLIYRAATLLQKAAHLTQGVHIQVEKHLPPGAGLGVGSSNAATTLLALNHLWDLQWPRATLMQLGVTLGADIPFFLYGKTALAEGIGDKLTPCRPDLPWLLIIVPPCSVSTVTMYTDPELTRNTRPFKIRAHANGEAIFPEGDLRNDFESLAQRRYPAIAEAMRWLSRFEKPRLSGSGASLFACFASRQAAEAVAQQMPKAFTGYVTQALLRSPATLALKAHIIGA